jgi:hypothetical protein
MVVNFISHTEVLDEETKKTFKLAIKEAISEKATESKINNIH